jgi:DNA-binding transcriptional ArsR family regulator
VLRSIALDHSTERVNIRGMPLDATLLALADPTRRKIIERLRRGPARVTELARPFPMSLNSVSKHIRVLERAKLVKRRVAGREHMLSFEPEPLAAVEAWISAQRAFWNAELDDLAARLAPAPRGKTKPKTKTKTRRTP